MELKTASKKSLIMGGIAVLVALLNIITLLFTLAKIEVSLFGVSKEMSVTGFSVISEYPAAIEKVGGWVSFYSIVHIIVSVAIICVFLYKFFKKDSYDLLQFAKKSNIISVILSVIYMINGFMTVSAAKKSGEGLYQVSGAAFVPFILILLLVIVYFAVNTYLHESVNEQDS